MKNLLQVCLSFLILVLLIPGCIKIESVDTPEPESPIGVIPKDFDWKTIKEVTCNVTVSSFADFGDNITRVIKIYSSPKLDNSSLIATGGATPSSPYNVKISLATSTPILYFQEIYPDGSKSMIEAQVNSSNLNVNFVKTMPPVSVGVSETAQLNAYKSVESVKVVANFAESQNSVGGTDNDGDGVPVELDVDDSDATVAYASYFPSAGKWGTYAFEDLWPVKGDYDINDYVIGFNITYLTNSSNMVTQMKVDYSLMAAGCSYELGAAVQLDLVSASSIKSVSGRELVGSEPFSIASNGTEKGVSKAVIPLFNNQRDYVSFPGYLNTVNGTYTSSPSCSIDIKFTNPIPKSDVSMSSFNLFIVVNSREKEVHLPTYSVTSKFNSLLTQGSVFYPGDIFKSTDGMMWGLMFPETFNYPSERNSIFDAYKYFADWATSGGTTNLDWYSSIEASYINSGKIYQIPGNVPTIPSVSTENISEITSESAISGGVVTSIGGSTITERGVCWSTNPSPTVEDSRSSDGIGSGSFTSTIYGLSPNNTYYVRAYATNSFGTAYGEEISFTSQVEEAPQYPGTDYTAVKIDGLWWAPVNAGYSSSTKYGLLYQWHRKFGQGYENSGVIEGPVELAEGNRETYADNFFTSSNNWSSENKDTWVMTDEYNPCPDGWRVPTNDEMGVLLGKGSVWVQSNNGGIDGLPGRWIGYDANGSRENSVFFPAAGYREYNTGKGKSLNSYGAYWSNDVNGTLGRGFDFQSWFISLGDGLKGYSFSIRCVKE